MARHPNHRSGSAPDVLLETVRPENIATCGIGCVASRRHEGVAAKSLWLDQRFAEGLRMLLFRDGRGTPLAFLEFIPGEHAWRPVAAEGWLFVHCLWVYPKGQAVGGLGSRLIQACVEEARRIRARGVAAMVSDGPWMAAKQVFLKNGFVQTAERDRFQLVTLRLRRGPAPSFRDLPKKWSRRRGLHIVYAPQCPYLPKSVHAIEAVAREHGIPVTITVLRNASEAQHAPSYYGVFNLLWNGRLLSDHYVSETRFRNILRREIEPNDE